MSCKETAWLSSTSSLNFRTSFLNYFFLLLFGTTFSKGTALPLAGRLFCLVCLLGSITSKLLNASSRNPPSWIPTLIHTPVNRRLPCHAPLSRRLCFVYIFLRFIFIKFLYRKRNALLLLLAGVVGSLDQALMRPDNGGVACLLKTKANTNKKWNIHIYFVYTIAGGKFNESAQLFSPQYNQGYCWFANYESGNEI